VKPLLPISAALLGVCLAANAQAPAKVTYAEHIAPIFRNVCTNCHNPDKKKAGLDLTTYTATLAGSENGPVIKPGNADGSLMYKVCTQSEEPKMPPKGDKLSEAELALLKNWIAGFALENPGSKPAQVAANKVDAAIVLLKRPDGPPPMPGDLPMEPFVRARQGNVILAMAASPWAPLVAVGGQRQVFLFNTETTERLGVLAFPEGFPNVLRFSRNAKLLLAAGGLGGKSGRVVLWDVTTGERAGTVGNEIDAVLAADISPDHQFVALGGADRRLKIFQTKDGKQTATIKKHTEWVTAIAFSPDGKFLASGDRNGGIEVWETGTDPKPFSTLAGHKAGVTALAFMPGVLASASEDGKVTLWNVKDGTEMKSWAAHNGGALWAEFSPDGRLATCGRDKVAKIWDATGKQIAATEAFSDLAVRCTINGERVIATDWTGEVRVCSLDGKRIGALDMNPPAIAEQISTAEKAIAESNGALPTLLEAVAKAEARVKAEKESAESKRKADILAAEARKSEGSKQIEALKVASASVEKMVNDLTGELAKAKAKAKAKDAVAKVRATGVEQQKTIAAPADESARAAAKKKLDELNAEIARRREERAKLTQGTAEYARANEAVQALKPEISKAEQALTSANQGGGVNGNPAESEAAKSAITAAQKNVVALSQQLQQAQTEMRKLKTDVPRQIETATKSIATAEGEIQKLQTPVKPTPVQAEAEQTLAKARAELDAANARIITAKAGVERWRRAQIYQTVFNAKQNAADKQVKYEEAVAAAKDAFRQVELSKQGLVVAQRIIAEAPKTIAAKEQALAAAKQATEAAKAAIVSAEKATAEKKTDAPPEDKPGAEIAELTKKLEAASAEMVRLRAERAKFDQGTPDYIKTNGAVQAQKQVVAKAEGALAAVKGKPASQQVVVAPELLEAVKKALAEAKIAADKISPAQKALDEAKKTVEEAKKQIVELKARIPQLEKDAVKNKAAAEKAAAVLAKEVVSAKAVAEKLREQYEAIKQSAKAANAAMKG
jgi:hypothetical protein